MAVPRGPLQGLLQGPLHGSAIAHDGATFARLGAALGDRAALDQPAHGLQALGLGARDEPGIHHLVQLLRLLVGHVEGMAIVSRGHEAGEAGAVEDLSLGENRRRPKAPLDPVATGGLLPPEVEGHIGLSFTLDDRARVDDGLWVREVRRERPGEGVPQFGGGHLGRRLRGRGRRGLGVAAHRPQRRGKQEADQHGDRGYNALERHRVPPDIRPYLRQHSLRHGNEQDPVSEHSVLVHSLAQRRAAGV